MSNEIDMILELLAYVKSRKSTAKNIKEFGGESYQNGKIFAYDDVEDWITKRL